MIRLTRMSSVLLIGMAITLGVAYALYSATVLRAGEPSQIDMRVDPATVDGSAGCQVTVSIIAEGSGISNLAGFQFELEFDPALVQVVDDAGTPALVEGIARGANLPSGFFFAGGVDNAAGVATVAGARQTALGASFTSVSLADITFDLIGAAGSSPTVTIPSDPERLVLSDASDPPQRISAGTLTPGTINIQADEGFPNISGNVSLQFRTPTTPWLGGVGFSSASVRAEGPINRTVPVASDGAFEICGAPDGDYTLMASAGGYLSAQTADDAVSVSGADVTVADVQLRGGDVNSSGLVDINDVTAITARFLQGPPQIGDCMDTLGRMVDINCSNLVDINDVTGTTSNFLRSSPQPWTP